MQRVAFGGPIGHHPGDPLGAVGADQGDHGGSLLAQQVEEAVERLLVPPDGSPYQPPGVVVDDDGQVAVPLLVADLVDPDPDQATERIVGRPSVGHHPGDDRSHCAPGDAHQLTDCRLGRVGDQPGHLVVEEPGVTGTVASPGHLGDGRTVLGTVYPWDIGLKEALHGPEIDRPPVAPTFPLVIARGTHSAAPTSALGRAPEAHVDHHRFRLLVEVDLLDHRRPVDTEHATPYVGTEHAILLTSSSGPSSSPKTRRGLALLASGGGQGTHGSRFPHFSVLISTPSPPPRP